MTEPSSTYRSWNRPATPEEVAEQRRVERRRNWIRPSMVVVAVGLAMFDAVAVLVASGIQTAVRVRTGYTCDTFFRVLAKDTRTGIWVVVVLVVVTLLAALATRRPWIILAVLVVQLGATAILVPNIIHKSNDYLAVADGRKNPVDVDTGGVACS